jgi:hypothetical protein
VFLGADFGALLASVLRPPHAVPLALVIWAVVAVTGLCRAINNKIIGTTGDRSCGCGDSFLIVVRAPHGPHPRRHDDEIRSCHRCPNGRVISPVQYPAWAKN